MEQTRDLGKHACSGMEMNAQAKCIKKVMEGNKKQDQKTQKLLLEN